MIQWETVISALSRMPATPNSRTIKLTLSYDGTDFCGWQVQPERSSIQGELALALHRVLGEEILPQASGRTDAGVHALAQVVSFVTPSPIPITNLHRALNRALPPTIRVVSAEVAPAGFHARYNAIAKTYEYRIFNRFQNPESMEETICPPTLARYTWNCPWRLDMAALQQSAAYILGEHDFTSFTAVDPEKHTDTTPRESAAPIGHTRRIFTSEWIVGHSSDALPAQQSPDSLPPLLIYRVRGSGFLHHMVRNLVGSFVDAACSRSTPEDIPRILAAQDRSAAGATAPANGLFLIHVEYL
ncbi:MAG TPA: tRNA pseudouridine synthase A [Acidobacteriaceae bacterium]